MYIYIVDEQVYAKSGSFVCKSIHNQTKRIHSFDGFFGSALIWNWE